MLVSARNKMAAGKTDESSEAVGQKGQSRPSHLCCYSQRVCNIEKLKGFDFCHKHILEDKASPFKPCDFYAKSNDRRCMNPAPKLHDKEKSYCIIHTRKAELRRAVEKRRKKRRRDSNAIEEDEEESITEKRKRTSSNASQKSVDSSQKDEEGHSTDDELGMELGIGGSLKVDSAWHGDVDSDAESVDSEEEDVLRHAGVWTLDEASKICCEKMIRLKSLYVAQYKRLFHVLKEKRRKYIQVIQAEQENEAGGSYLNPSEILRSPAHRKRHGVEAILHKQAKEKRHGTTARHQGNSHQRCTHVGEGLRCPNRILPLTKYCIHHISHDPNQLLFQSCSFKTGDQKTCTNMVPKIYPFSACQLHITLPSEPARTDVKKDLEGAKKRDEEKKASEKQTKEDKEALERVINPVTDKQLPIPKALQQKSSALIPPLAPLTTTIPSHTQDLAPTIKVSSVAPTNIKASTLKIEKMEVDPSSSLVGLLTKGGISSNSTPMEILSPASVDSPAGVQNISPTLLAASLAAVCSEAPSPAVTSPLAMSCTPNIPVASTSCTDPKDTSLSTVSTCITSSTTTACTSTLSTSSTPTVSVTPSGSVSSESTSKESMAKDSVDPPLSSTLSATSDIPSIVQPPQSSTVDPPSSSTVVIPSSSTVVTPSSSTVDPPSSSTVVLPSSSTVDPPLSSTVDPPPSSTVVPPSSSTVDPPSSSTVDPPSSSTVDPPPSSTVVPPSSSIVDPPLSSTLSATSDVPLSSSNPVNLSSEDNSVPEKPSTETVPNIDKSVDTGIKTDSIDKTPTSTSTGRPANSTLVTTEGLPSNEDQNPTTMKPAVIANIITPSSDSVSCPSLDTIPKDSQTAVQSESENSSLLSSDK